MSHPYTDEFGFPLTAAQAAKWKRTQIDVAGFDYERGDRRHSTTTALAVGPGDPLLSTILPRPIDPPGASNDEASE